MNLFKPTLLSLCVAAATLSLASAAHANDYNALLKAKKYDEVDRATQAALAEGRNSKSASTRSKPMSSLVIYGNASETCIPLREEFASYEAWRISSRDSMLSSGASA